VYTFSLYQVLQFHDSTYEVVTLHNHDPRPVYIQIYADFDATSDKPKRFQVLVDIGSGDYRYCYLDTRNNGVAYQATRNIVTYMNLSRKIKNSYRKY
jgi:hypothetical protein